MALVVFGKMVLYIMTLLYLAMSLRGPAVMKVKLQAPFSGPAMKRWAESSVDWI